MDETARQRAEREERERVGGLFGDDGITLLGGRNRPSQGDGSGLAVNSFLWRASLDTVSFMPLVSADPFGGVIITDWYSPEASSFERFKMTVYVLDRDLRADGIRVAVFKQMRDGAGGWVDTQVEPRTGTDIENAILTRARQMRMEATAKN